MRKGVKKRKASRRKASRRKASRRGGRRKCASRRKTCRGGGNELGIILSNYMNFIYYLLFIFCDIL
jgi:hypothetical protein